MKNKRKAKIIALIIISLLLLIAALPLLLAVYIYNSNFGERYETAAWVARSIDEFDGLQSERYLFTSNDGQNLTGYKYYKEDGAPAKGVIIIAHGLGGGGHNTYIDVADYFASNGYYIFAYDATGNDESEGKSVKGLPQGVIDLDYAIRFVKESDEFAGLPIMLFGHSWGAYSAGSVLSVHPDIRAVVMVAGFDTSMDMFEAEGRRLMGGDISAIMPFISIVEKMKFGRYSSYSCVDGFLASDAKVMLIHSADDEMVSFEEQFKRFSGIYQNDPRFIFAAYEDRGHDYIYYSDDSKERRNDYNKQFEEYVNSTGAEINADLKTAYMNENGNKPALFELDSELMENMLSFYDSCGAAK